MPSLFKSKAAALRRLKEMQFRRYEYCRESVDAFFKHRRAIEQNALHAEIWKICDWLMCPLTFWAVDYLGIARQVLARIEAGRDFDADLILLLTLIAPPPSAFAQKQVGEYEITVSKGLYDHLTKQPEKFAETEMLRHNDVALKKAWNQIKGRFPLEQFSNARGVVRRSLSRERNFEPYLKFAWGRKRERFQILLDALCYRWCLYGFEHDSPLLLKVSVNPTPHGTMIVVPRHMSLDGSRDLDWPAISKVHRAHGAGRQGPVLSSGRIQREAQKNQARQLDAEARRQRLRGKPRYEFILGEMGQDLRKISWLKRLLRKD